MTHHLQLNDSPLLLSALMTLPGFLHTWRTDPACQGYASSASTVLPSRWDIDADAAAAGCDHPRQL